jgi:hypothetical protein
VTDAAGRRGIALRMLGVYGGNIDLIFDPKTHAYLGQRNTILRGGKETLSNSVAVLRMAVVDRPKQLP